MSGVASFVRHLRDAVLALSAAALISACGSISEQTASVIFTSPGKYSVYNCADIERTQTELRKRAMELEQLMARASEGTGGGFAGGLAYRSEYLQARGDLVEAVKAKSEKQCVADDKYSSGRSIY